MLFPRITAAFVLAAGLATISNADEIKWASSIDAAVKQGAAESKLVMIEFSSPG